MKAPFSLRDILLCVAFFTRLPLPHLDFSNRTLAQAIWAAPIAGLLVALLAFISFALGAALGLPPGPATALALAAAMLTTGCLHEDGLSDVADGFGGGSTVERKLDIMRDSRIGSYGTAAFMMSMLLRWSALAAIAAPMQVFSALIAAHCASRALPGALMYFLPPARSDGLSAGAGTVARSSALIGAAIGSLSLLVLGLGPAIITLIVLALVFAGFSLLCRAQIGGQTGDCAGALQQLAEIAILLVATAAFS
ncbi:adenosylcobinamide-GDP ribazoletransferase [Aquamicrobium segne]|uniref:Adenosylcobinamide-GDP ribazoletransferase n=1 Tax=Aquamicrobium segne TaxID=469547 RepID=A0ABW0GVB3_9HYPH